ncbi:hypothetical protein N9A86_00335 [Akkermansiaceae bacterium]|nr:hypothetical protein [Akkermansiaceae bacterium]
MKLTPEDPMMTAYVLDELCEFDNARVAMALENDSTLAGESSAIADMAALLSGTLSADHFSLGEKRREAILKAGRRPDAAVLVSDHKKRARRQSFMAVVGVAAVVTIGFVGLSRLGVDAPVSPGVGVAGQGEGEGGGIAEADLPLISPFSTDVIRNVQELSMALPLSVQVADPSLVERTLIESGKLPGMDHFRVENWVNILQAESKPQVQVGPVGVSAELGPCSWDHEKALLLVNLQGGENPQGNVSARINFDPERVESVRLVGESYTPENLQGDGGVLLGNQSYFYEVKLTEFEGKLGQIDLELDQGAETARSGMLPLGAVVRDDSELSDDFRVALTLAKFARYGRTEDGEFSQIAAEARELLGSVQNAQNRYALDVVLLAEERLESLKD